MRCFWRIVGAVALVVFTVLAIGLRVWWEAPLWCAHYGRFC